MNFVWGFVALKEIKIASFLDLLELSAKYKFFISREKGK